MRRNARSLALVVLFLLPVSAPVLAGLAYIDPLYSVQVTSNVVYGTGISQGQPKDLLADIYQPVDAGNGPVLENRPAVVIQDGGAWTSASKTHGRVTTPAFYLAERGYTVIVTDYRQGAPGLPFGLADPGPDAPVTTGQTIFGNAPWDGLTTSGHIYDVYPGMNPIRAGIEDFAVAMDWTRTNAAALGIDPNRIGIAGGSAGGIDALLLQYNLNPVDPRYEAQAVMALVSSMMENWPRIQPGGPPAFLLNNTLDQVVPWSPEMSQRFVDVGIYREQWFQPADLLYHDVDWYLDLDGLSLLERARDFLVDQLAGGPVFIDPNPGPLGDISGDGQVDIGDFTLWGDAFGSTGAGLPADLSNDGQVDIGDFTIWGDNFGSTAAVSGGGAEGHAVPEPDAMILLAIGMASLLLSVRRRGV